MRAPYGLEIIDSCLDCKLRSEMSFCDQHREALASFEAARSNSIYPKGSILCVVGAAQRPWENPCVHGARAQPEHRHPELGKRWCMEKRVPNVGRRPVRFELAAPVGFS